MLILNFDRTKEIPPPKNEIVQYVSDKGMPRNHLEVFNKLGFFSAPPSPLTPDSTLDEIHKNLNNSDIGFRIMVNVPQILVLAKEQLQYVDEYVKKINGVDDNTIDLYVSTPKNITPTHGILHTHSGAMAMGSTGGAAHRAWCRLMAKEGYLVVSVNFRNSSGLSKRTPFPGGLNDSVSGLQWLADRPEIKEITLVGESGGGNMAIAVGVRSAKRGIAVGKVKNAVIWCPYVAGPSIYGKWDTTDLKSLQENDGVCGLSIDYFYMAKTYTPNEEDWTVGEAWTYFLTDEEISLLPPISLHTSDLDMLRDEAIALSKRLSKAGKLVTHVNHSGATHCMHLMPFTPGLMQFMDVCAQYTCSFIESQKK